MTAAFGEHLRQRRMELLETDRGYSIRALAERIGVEPSFLSKVERGEQPPPSERRILELARELGEDPDVLLAMAGKISGELREAIVRRPQLFAELIRSVRDAPDEAVLRVVREVRDGDW